MKFSASMVCAVFAAFVLTHATAQIKVGSVTLTRSAHPVTEAQQRPAPAVSIPGRAENGSDTLSAAPVPAGAQEVRGRVLAAGGTVNLPAGSTVKVSVNDLTKRAQVVQIAFKASRLSTPYQIVFNSGRLNRTHTYAVQASVVDAGGQTLYTSDQSAKLPSARRATVNVTVR